ncbi:MULTISPECIES: VOC family protein [unclassified Variovorax]|uniref:VOC family protein n=1 Tax=unclassified Variovorax TaxID=663243 RepID=UPI00111A7F8A|nr:VOC family protein [Variovorax sp. KBS0712]TSD56917.1 glyoxalase [Variovorax sp. KBS0712]BER90323.1 glyoxalase [Variovorax sp.]
MKIVGLDTLVFGVDNVTACRQYLLDYGLHEAGDGRFEALDGTAVVIAAADDPALPPARVPNCALRKTVMGVRDPAELEAIAAELAKDREVRRLPDGSIESVDDDGFLLGFQLTVRRPVTLAAEVINATGSPFQRPANQLGVDAAMPLPVRPRTLSHVVYFVPDPARSEAFYARLGFRVVDRFVGMGPFLQPAGTLDHHTHFFITAPEHVKGVEHFTFHFGGPTEVLLNGKHFVEKGYQSFWGPGRHQMGSNWFWYFKSPFGCNMEMDADMDLHDASWQAREWPIAADRSQVFLFAYREAWAPGPDAPPTDGSHA